MKNYAWKEDMLWTLLGKDLLLFGTFGTILNVFFKEMLFLA